MPTEKIARGLAGVVVAETSLSSIDGEQGVLSYRGYDVHDLARNATFEDIVHLLWHGEAPNRAQREDLRSKLAREAKLPPEVVELLRTAARKATPMDALRTGVSALSLSDPDADDDSREAIMRKAVRLLARLPQVITAYHRLREWSDPIPPDPSLSMAGNFLHGLTGRRPNETEERVLDTCLVLHADHGFNASTFTARVVVSTLSDLYSAVTAAIGSLKGPLHGGANTAVMRMLREIGDESQAESYVDQLLNEGKRIMGFGHRVYRTEDPRATWLRQMSGELAAQTGDRHWYDLSRRVEQAVKQRKDLNCNVDFYSASVYHYLGIPDDLFTPIFAMSRTAGWVGHCLEQLADNTLIRPRAKYVGPTNQTWSGAGR